MVRRLLVGVAEAGEVNEPRRYLLDLLHGLSDLGVDVQVALFEDGPVRRDLEVVADVRLMSTPAPRSPGGLVQSLARRLGADLADRVHDVRTRADLEWIEPPDCIHVHGPRAAPLLRYLRTAGVPVTTYAHPWDFSVTGLQPLDLQRLLARTDRFLAADATVSADLVAAGADPARITTVLGQLRVSVPPLSSGQRAAKRARWDLPAARMVVGVPPVADWADAPDLTLALAWELERLAGPDAPLIHWYGMPGSGEPRWSVDFDVDRIGLQSLRVVTDEPGWADLVEMVDLVVLPTRTTATLPDDCVQDAARVACPIACWDGDPLADEVARWGGAVVERGDVAAMAAHVYSVVADGAALHRAREAVWLRSMTDVEQVVPLSIPMPGAGR